MALTLVEAAKTSRNPLAAGLMLGIATSDELISQIMMVPKKGESFMYNREKALPTVEFVAPNHTSLTESHATFDRVMVPLRLIVSNVDVYNFAEEQQDDTQSQSAVQVTQKLKALGRTLGQKAITGAYATSVTITPAIGGVTGAVTRSQLQDSDRHGPGSLKYTTAGTLLQYRAPGDVAYGAAQNVGTNGTYVLESDNPNRKLQVTIVAASLPGSNTEVLVYFASTTNEFDGMKALVPSAQTIASAGANGDALSFDVLDQMIDEKVKVRNRRFFLMNGKMKRKFYSLMRALGGTDPTHVALPGVNGPIPTYRGIPILQNDWISSDETKGGGTTLSSVYLVDLSEEGFYMAVGAGREGLSANLDPRVTRVAGVRVKEIGELEAAEAVRRRISWYGATALSSELAIARASELVTA